jgi:alginate O-acetyltransferase complex protein AlgJ
MKRLTQSFLLLVLCALLVVPTINILSSTDPLKFKWKKRTLYNMDFASSPFTDMLYALGISMVPRDVVIGLNGWLFLGDRFENVISDGRRGISDKAIANGASIGDASMAWDTWLRQNGVKLYKVMVAPNKESIYPELMPFWARPLPPTATDALMAGTDSKIYIDLRDALKQAKATQTEALYFKTDTHWNSLGAGIAFRAFAKEVAGALPELRWPAENAFQLFGVGSRQETDLVRILRLRNDVTNRSPSLGIENIPVETTHYELETEKVIRTGGNPEVGDLPVIVRSRDALNRKRVLWLRDSFGVALSPFMAATFHEVIQVYAHDTLKSERRFAELVKAWRPDYVFVTVVERSARRDLFTTLPPPIKPCISSCT